jgi:hypothetical protein
MLTDGTCSYEVEVNDVSGDLLHSLAHNFNSTESKRANNFTQERSLPSIRLNQHDLQVRQGNSKCQAREPSPRPDVGDPSLAHRHSRCGKKGLTEMKAQYITWIDHAGQRDSGIPAK